jgi:signal transduction histidine kinase
MDSGLVEALRVAAERAASDVTVTSSDVGRHPTEIETAVYFCCTEALQNSAKHAPGAAVRLHVEATADVVRFSVEDDGPGPVGSELSAGHGLSNMNDRVGALGGTLVISPSPTGGTLVSGEIPLPSPAP